MFLICLVLIDFLMYFIIRTKYRITIKVLVLRSCLFILIVSINYVSNLVSLFITGVLSCSHLMYYRKTDIAHFLKFAKSTRIQYGSISLMLQTVCFFMFIIINALTVGKMRCFLTQGLIIGIIFSIWVIQDR